MCETIRAAVDGGRRGDGADLGHRRGDAGHDGHPGGDDPRRAEPEADGGTCRCGGTFRRRFALPTAFQNDANAAAYGEFWAGAGRGARSMVLFTLGTGVGGGIIVSGATAARG